MGACESIENRKRESSNNLNKDEFFQNFSSSNLPSISSSVFPQTDNLMISKKHISSEKTNPLKDKEYILPETIAKRGDISKKYKISKTILGDGATALVYLAENKKKKKICNKAYF